MGENIGPESREIDYGEGLPLIGYGQRCDTRRPWGFTMTSCITVSLQIGILTEGGQLAPGSPERSRSPLPTSMSYSALKEKADAPAQPQPPPRPTTLPPSAAAAASSTSSSSTRQGNARFTDDEVEALLALAPTPTHDTLTHALDLPQREAPQRQESGGGTTAIYPKL